MARRLQLAHRGCLPLSPGESTIVCFAIDSCAFWHGPCGSWNMLRDWSATLVSIAARTRGQAAMSQTRGSRYGPLLAGSSSSPPNSPLWGAHAIFGPPCQFTPRRCATPAPPPDSRPRV